MKVYGMISVALGCSLTQVAETVLEDAQDTQTRCLGPQDPLSQSSHEETMVLGFEDFLL